MDTIVLIFLFLLFFSNNIDGEGAGGRFIEINKFQGSWIIKGCVSMAEELTSTRILS